jgi:polysaccharide export outer membrane protein
MILNKKKNIFLTSVLSIVLVSCVTTKRTNYLQKPNAFIPSYEIADSVPDYKLQVGDELSIRVFSLEQEANYIFNQGQNLSSLQNQQGNKNIYTYTIYSDSCINFPVIGRVNVVGKTTRDAGFFLKENLKGQFIVNDFSVMVSLVNNNFSIISDKGGAGVYPIDRNKMNIFQAIASSQELMEYADRAHVKIVRNTGNGTIVKEFDIRSRDLLDSEFYYVKPNDVIYVQSFKGQFFRFNTFLTILSAITSTVTLGFFIWGVTGGR